MDISYGNGAVSGHTFVLFESIQCDIDLPLIDGEANTLLFTYGTCIRAAPRHLQKKWLVEQRLELLTTMACSFFIRVKLPDNIFWYWAI